MRVSAHPGAVWILHPPRSDATRVRATRPRAHAPHRKRSPPPRPRLDGYTDGYTDGYSYDRPSYEELIGRVRELLPGAAISSDFISGFCGETEDDHLQTLSLLRQAPRHAARHADGRGRRHRHGRGPPLIPTPMPRPRPRRADADADAYAGVPCPWQVRYERAYMFAYSLREKTHAHRTLSDDVPEAVKQRRLREVIDTFTPLAKARNDAELGRVHLLLLEGTSRKSEGEWVGRTDTGKKVVIPRAPVASDIGVSSEVELRKGDYVAVRVVESISANTLRALPLSRTTIGQFDASRRTGHAAL